LECEARQELSRRLSSVGARRVLRLRLDGDRVRIGGQAVTVLRGELIAGSLAS